MHALWCSRTLGRRPECKFPTSQGGKAHLAIIADEGLSIPAANESAAAFVVRAKSAAAKPIATPSYEPKEVLYGSD